jgi:ectoine hydroxylase-related dioxygenase (phytanoyl-CoA dioxygenase family)
MPWGLEIQPIEQERQMSEPMTELGAASVATGIPQELQEAFRRDGAIVLRGAFVDWVEPLRRAVAENMGDPSPFQRSYQPDDGSAPFFQDYCNWQRFPELGDFVSRSPAAALAAQLMDSRTARFFHDHVLVKEPGTSIVTPWHQDQPYYCVEGQQSVSFWIPLDPVDRSTVMECVAGSHRWGQDFRPMRFNGQPLYAQDGFDQLPDIEALRSELTILGWSLEPGDAIAFNFRTIHGAPANRSASRRRVVSARWVGDDARFAVRAGATSPPFPGLGLADGDPLDAPIFPVVYRR